MAKSKEKPAREKRTPEQKKARREAFARFCKTNRKKLLIAGAAFVAVVALAVVIFTPHYLLGNKLLDEAAKRSLGVDKLTKEDLPRITELTVVGNRALNPAAGDTWENWSTYFDERYYSVNGESVEQGDIEDVSKLAECVNLEKLTLCWQNIHDPSAIYALPKLKELYMPSNEIWVFEGAEQMTQLEVLDLFGCPFGTFAPLSKLTNLRTLNLSHTFIKDIEGIENMDKLETLGLRYCYQLTDLSPLGRCTFPAAQDGIVLDLSYQLIDLAVLENIKRYASLRADNVAASNIVPYLAGAEITELSLSGCDLMDFTIIGQIKGLKTLTVGGNYLDNLNGIENLTELVTLDLRDNDTLMDLSPLLTLPKLERVNLSPDMYDAYNSIEGQAHFEITGLD